MIQFIKMHWKVYVFLAVTAVLLGAAAAYIVGVKGSTPPELRAKRIAAEQGQTVLERSEGLASSTANAEGSAEPSSKVGSEASGNASAE
ncbi:hypothetical protein K6V98_05545 [Collinsella sp. AGMB00827]|uniref:Uncharacterized protein n=1 Tax=Collinsella ureilytica TaxID=2869515 RepID=A0ABS7MKC5_9ACTN|nr:hypothetical protein [Collinsella urealyticum]MBY4797817.1 hypothetical protein [Collinsella urealyticum]